MSEGYHTETAFRERMAARQANPGPPSPLRVVYHCAAMPGARHIIAEQFALMAAVGLTNPATIILGPPAERASAKEAAARFGVTPEIVAEHDSLRLCEGPSVTHAWEWARGNPNGAVLYFHTKGASAPQDEHKKQWRRVMQRLVVAEWEENLNRLAAADAVGCAWQPNHDYPHFCGNFWMARCDWLFNLSSPYAYRDSRPDFAWAGAHSWKRRMYPETWIGSEPWHHIDDRVGIGTRLWDADAWRFDVRIPGFEYSVPRCDSKELAMIPEILTFATRVRQELHLPSGNVLEVGSRDINGNPRQVFADAATYIGLDAEPGPAVDVVGEATGLVDRFGREKFDSVVCFETLEHTIRPWDVVAQLKAVLKPGGLLWISTPTFGFPLHRYPVDCYRFGEDAYRMWMYADFELLALEKLRDHLDHPVIVAVGRKPSE